MGLIRRDIFCQKKGHKASGAVEAAGTPEIVVGSADLFTTETMTNSEAIVSVEITNAIDSITVEVMSARETTGTILSEEDAQVSLTAEQLEAVREILDWAEKNREDVRK